ncbi:MAG: TGS domain-containing protein [Candidatus Azambacteria bacterium]|nr:TGS domain-containing protein [Candidatus Azambacteria bacterium]
MNENEDNKIKLFLLAAKDIRVVLAKLTARYRNVSQENALETLEIYAPTADRLGMGELKSKLEDAAFKCLYPKEFKLVESEAAKKYEARAEYLNKIEPELHNILGKEKIVPLQISARVKHFYSLYKKLLRCDMNFDEIHDFIAARVIAKDANDCYLALGAIHQAWRPVTGQVKDYIAIPKPNGYRSLHTSVFGPEEKIIEIQIRTPEMHAQAENGIAAHWAYKERNFKEKNQYSKTRDEETAWIEQLREWQKAVRGSDEFFKSLKIESFKNHVFVSTPKGDVIDLPGGATPVDFAFYVHTTIGNECVGAKINGKMAPLDTKLNTGDSIEILIQKGKKPSIDWLNFVKTDTAKDRIKSFLREKNTILRTATRGAGKPKKTRT